MPNLRMLPVAGIVVAPEDPPGTGMALRFWTRIGNSGRSPLALHWTGADLSEGRQCIAWQVRVCSAFGAVVSGMFAYGQEAFPLVEGLFRYELRTVGPTGLPADLVVGRQVGQWLVEANGLYPGYTHDAGTLLPGPFPAGSPAGQGLSPGRVLYFDADTHRQQLPLQGVLDGTYLLSMTVDPRQVIQETDESDNTSQVSLELSGGGRVVRVLEE